MSNVKELFVVNHAANVEDLFKCLPPKPTILSIALHITSNTTVI